MPLLTHPPGHSLAHLEIAVHMADLPNPMKHGKGLVKAVTTMPQYAVLTVKREPPTGFR